MNQELKRFAEKVAEQEPLYWLRHPSLESRVSHTGGRLDQLYQVGRFQIERVIHKPYGVIPMHRHPDVDTYEFPLWGSGVLWIGRRKFELDDEVTPWCPMFISRNWYHGGKGYDRGGCFLSVQYWYVEPVQCITKNWVNR